MNLKEIVETVRIKSIEKYEEDKCFTNTNMGKEMIEFCSKTIDCRKVNDWGRDEDTDLFIGLDDQGWVKYINTVHCGAGPLEIKSENIIRVDDDFIVNYLKSSQCTNKEFMWFMKKACNYYPMI